MFKKLRLTTAAPLLAQKRVLMRADFNVPIKNGKITSTTRITETIPSIQKILAQKPKGLVLMSHLGRPDGKKKPEDSMAPVAKELEKLLGQKVRFFEDCVGKDALEQIPKMKEGEIALLENLRFYGEEEGKSVNEKGEKVKVPKDKIKDFSKKLSSFGEIFVNDAFGTAHRAHASMTGIDLPVRMAGLLMEKELEFFGKVLDNPKRPVVIVLGGAKVTDKLPLINNLLNLADEILIGGGMAFTFIKVLNNVSIGKSLFDVEGAKQVKDLIEKAKAKNIKLTIPVDFVISGSPKSAEGVKTLTADQSIPDSMLGVDIGPETVKKFAASIAKAKTIVMNGPMGIFEVPEFSNGSKEVVKEILKATKNNGAVSVVGGGDSVSLVGSVEGAKKGLSHVSTGGGASLELLEGKKLPGVEHLTEDKK